MAVYGREMRSQFTLSDKYTFVNHGAYGAVAKPVNEARHRKQAEFESAPDVWFRQNYENYYQENVRATAEVLGAKHENIALVANTTTGINAVLKSLTLGADDVILINSWTYGAVKNAVQWTKECTGCSVMMVNIRVPVRSEDITEAYKNVITRHKIKLAIIDGISSVPATFMPFRELASLCRENNTLVLLDGAHMPGQVDVQLEEWGFDFFVGNLHKWCYTNRGCAVLYVKPEHHSFIHPTVISKNLHHSNLALRFYYQGTNDETTYTVVQEAIKFYKGVGGLQNITAYTKNLVTKAAAMLVERWKTHMMEISDDMLAPNMRMVKMPELKLYPAKQEIEGDVSTLYGDNKSLMLALMKRFHIIVMAVHLQGESYVRISANIYNCLEDYEKLADAILTLKEEENKI